MIYAILVLCLLGSGIQAVQAAKVAKVAPAVQEQDLDEQDLSRLAGIYVKDGNENGQLRFLASGLSSTGTTSNTGLNSALNQYITNKQNMLEQLRPTTGTGTGTGTSLVTGTTSAGTGTLTSTGTGTSNGLVSTTSNGAIYVNLGNSGSSSSSSSSTSANQAALNQVIYGSSPIADLLPQIVGQAVVSQRRPGQVNRRRLVGNRRRVNNRRGGNNQIRRRRRGNKRGKNKAQVMVVRPNRG